MSIGADAASKAGCICPSCKQYILAIAILGTMTGILMIVLFGVLLVYHISKPKPIIQQDSMDCQSDTAPEVPDTENSNE